MCTKREIAPRYLRFSICSLIVRLVQSSAFEHEDLRSIFRIHIKMLGMLLLVNPALGRWRQEDHWGLCTCWSNLIVEFQANERGE